MAADVIGYAPATQQRIGPNQRGDRQKLVQHVDGERIQLLAGAAAGDLERIGTDIELRRDIRREVVAEPELKSGGVIGNAILVQKSVIRHRTDINGARVIVTV